MIFEAGKVLPGFVEDKNCSIFVILMQFVLDAAILISRRFYKFEQFALDTLYEFLPRYDFGHYIYL